MTTGMNFWDGGVWSFILTMTLLFGAMMVANILRNLIPAIRRLMIPSAVLGGFLLLVVGAIWKWQTGAPLVDAALLEMITYHGLGLGFAAMALRRTEKQPQPDKTAGAFDAGVTVVSGYLIQALVGLAITIGLSFVLHNFFASGILLPMGYGQGPGQAYNWGRTYENTYGFVGGTSFGLTIAAMGFVSASVGGVVYLNWLRRKGLFTGETGKDVVDEHTTLDTITSPGEIPLSESMDKFTIQLALVFLSYSLAYGFMAGVNAIIETGALGSFGYNTIQPLIWGFNFLFGTLAALLVKTVLGALKKKGVIHREYTNNFMQNRISGFMFDCMVLASIAAIDLSAFRNPEFIVPLGCLCVAGAVVTYWYLNLVCKHVFTPYRHEAFLSLYGMQTGTASTGVILLREIDPRFQTQAAANLVYHQPWAIVFGFPMMLLMSVAAQSLGKAFMTLGILAALFAVMNVISFRKKPFKRKNAQKG